MCPAQASEAKRPSKCVKHSSNFAAPAVQVDALYADFGDALRAERYARAAKEGIAANAAWQARNAAPLCAWLGAA